MPDTPARYVDHGSSLRGWRPARDTYPRTAEGVVPLVTSVDDPIARPAGRVMDSDPT
jgi:hypothetical protein